MSGAALDGNRPRVVFAPGLRFARILWRLLPTLTLILVAHFVAWLFDADTPAYYQLLYVAGAFLVYGVLAASIREVLSPDRPWLRLIPVSDL